MLGGGGACRRGCCDGLFPPGGGGGGILGIVAVGALFGPLEEHNQRPIKQIYGKKKAKKNTSFSFWHKNGYFLTISAVSFPSQFITYMVFLLNFLPHL